MKTQKSNHKFHKQPATKIKPPPPTTQSNSNKISKPNTNEIINIANIHYQSTHADQNHNLQQRPLLDKTNSQKKNITQDNQPLQIKITPSKKNIMVYYHRFISQVTVLLTQLFKTPASQLLSTPISYIYYLEALKSLKMIHLNYEPYPNDLVSELWLSYISGHNIGYFIIIIASILGLYQGKQNEHDKYFQNKFQLLRTTRMETQKNIEDELEKDKQSEECFHGTKINDKNKKVVQYGSSMSKKNTKCNTINTDRTLTDRINQSVVCNEKSRVQIDQYNYDENYYIHHTEPTTARKVDLSGNIRTQMLYEKSKQKPIIKKINKTKQDIQYQRYINQLTFKPKITKSKLPEKQNSLKCIVKGQKHTINRMIKARVQRQIRKIINEKGITYNEKVVDKMRKQKYGEILAGSRFGEVSDKENQEDEIDKYRSEHEMKKTVIPKLQLQLLPITEQHPKPNLPTPEQDLVIEVYISQDHKERLVVRKGECLDEVAYRFISEHGLPIQKKQQLVQLLQISISHALCPIDELDEEDQLASARSLFRPESFR